MFENKYNSETNTKETEYVPVKENEKKKSGTAVQKILQTIGALCCVAALSAGSIAGYKYISENDIKFFEEDTTVSEDKSLVQNDTIIEDNTSVSADSTEGKSLYQLSMSENALSTQEIYQKVIPSVVGITSIFEYEEPTSYYGGFFGYGNESRGSTKSQSAGTGTGIVMSANGYIITNAHVIYYSAYSVKASDVKVRLYDETEYDAEIVGYDTQTDIAVLKVKDAPALTAAEFGDSSTLNVGDSAIAIGNPLGFDLFGTLTVGYISGLNREMAMDDTVMNLIQTDAAINAGNSGGPLINDRGQVIGINSMKLSNQGSSEASIEGLCFAIPINEAQKIVNDLLTNGYVTGRPQLGITCQNVSASQYSPVDGVYVVSVNEGGCAEKAGLAPGDVIVGADNQTVTTITELNQIKNKFNAGDTLTLTVIRNNKYYEVEVTLEEVVVSAE